MMQRNVFRPIYIQYAQTQNKIIRRLAHHAVGARHTSQRIVLSTENWVNLAANKSASTTNHARQEFLSTDLMTAITSESADVP